MNWRLVQGVSGNWDRLKAVSLCPCSCSACYFLSVTDNVASSPTVCRRDVRHASAASSTSTNFEFAAGLWVGKKNSIEIFLIWILLPCVIVSVLKNVFKIYFFY